jgi:hypothetical protein
MTVRQELRRGYESAYVVFWATRSWPVRIAFLPLYFLAALGQSIYALAFFPWW